MTDELKPVRCGCGGEAEVENYDVNCGLGKPNYVYDVYCTNCRISTYNFPSEFEAIEAWNRAMGGKPERKWTPVTEALPKDMDRILTTIVRSDGEKRVRSGHYYKGYFMMDNGDTWNGTDKEVIAWMPLPEAWEGE